MLAREGLAACPEGERIGIAVVASSPNAGELPLDRSVTLSSIIEESVRQSGAMPAPTTGMAAGRGISLKLRIRVSAETFALRNEYLPGDHAPWQSVRLAAIGTASTPGGRGLAESMLFQHTVVARSAAEAIDTLLSDDEAADELAEGIPALLGAACERRARGGR